MSVTYTTNMLMGKPTVANSYNVWGAELNTLIDIVDLSVFSNNFAENAASHTGLNFYYKNGRVQDGTTTTKVSASYVTLTDNQTNYIEVSLAGTVSANTSGFTAGKIPLYTVVVTGGVQGTATDHRNYFNISASNYWSINSDSIDSTYNLMVGTGTKKDWKSTYNYMQLGGNGSIAYTKTATAPSHLFVNNNLYYDDTDDRWEIITTGYTSQIELTGGTVIIKTGDTGAADAAASLATTAEFDEYRNMLIGGASSPQKAVGNASGCISLKNVEQPSVATAGQVDIFCTSDPYIGIYMTTAVVADTDETQFSHKVPIQINGSDYYIMLIEI